MIEARGSDIDHLKWMDKSFQGNWDKKYILDLGCGSGYVCKTLSDRGAKAVGVDIIDPSESSPTELNWKFLKTDLEKTGWGEDIKSQTEGNNLDVICTFDILEHLSSPWGFLSECNKVLNQGGYLFLTTPNSNSWERYVKPESWSGVQDPQHKILFTKYSLQFALKKIGFEILHLAAPIRKLGSLNGLIPDLGGQIFCVARKKS